MTQRSVSRRKAKTSRRSSVRKTPKRRKREKFVEIGQFQYPIVGGLVEVEGHQLNPVQVAMFQDKYRERLAIANRQGSDIRHPVQYAYRSGLMDLLWAYRPAPKAERRLLDLSEDLRNIAMRIGQLRDFGFYADKFASQEGTVLLLRLVREAERRLFKIKHFATSMATEHSTKLQDWTKREVEFQQLEDAKL